jgi:drug/metabolite transporter (DMT)-like permease
MPRPKQVHSNNAHPSLKALPPVIILPVSYFAFKEKLGWQGILGTLLALTGVAVLFLA